MSKPADWMEGLPPEVYRAVWSALPWSVARDGMTLQVAADDAFAEAWRASEAALATYDGAEAAHPGVQVVLHKRLNALTWRARALDVHRARPVTQALVGGDVGAALRRAALACVLAVPARFRKGTPFGAACTSAWVAGHRILARELGHADSPAWARFEQAVEDVDSAPRTHAEGNLKRADRHEALLEAGRKAPWLAEAVAATGTAVGPAASARPARRGAPKAKRAPTARPRRTRAPR